MGVNDLLDQFRRWARSSEAVRHGARVCHADLKEVARNAWHPVSEPPTEADGELVLVYLEGDIIDMTLRKQVGPKKLGTMGHNGGPARGKILYWARLRDVILMPPEGEGE